MKKIKLENTNEVLYYDKLDNGLEVYMLPNNNVNKFYLTLAPFPLTLIFVIKPYLKIS